MLNRSLLTSAGPILMATCLITFEIPNAHYLLILIALVINYLVYLLRPAIFSSIRRSLAQATIAFPYSGVLTLHPIPNCNLISGT